jgi:hypothetical protein
MCETTSNSAPTDSFSALGATVTTKLGTYLNGWRGSVSKVRRTLFEEQVGEYFKSGVDNVDCTDQSFALDVGFCDKKMNDKTHIIKYNTKCTAQRRFLGTTTPSHVFTFEAL